MTANWFEAKVKYVKVGEDGKEKKMSELYLLDAMSYTEAESRITENLIKLSVSESKLKSCILSSGKRPFTDSRLLKSDSLAYTRS